MATLNKEAVTTLTGSQNGVCLSLFMPLQREPDKAEENRIRIKNLSKEAEEKLAQYDASLQKERYFLEPIETVLQNGRSANSSGGLAMFLAKDFSQFHFLPHPFTERVVIGEHFYIKPLLPLLTEAGEFYVLALSQNEVCLYRGNREGLEACTPDNLPQSLADALVYEDPEKRQQYHTSTDSPASAGQQPAAFHTHHPNEEKKSRIRRFFQQVDRAVSDYLNQADAPLILAGVDYLLPLYREANSYAPVLEEAIIGNPYDLAQHKLHERAYGLARQHFLQTKETAVQQFHTLNGSNQTSYDLAETVAAAHYGRIDTLMVAAEREHWGTFDPQTGQVQEADSDAQGQELTNLAIQKTLEKGGEAYLLPLAEMPENASLAATFRYPK